MAVVRRNNDNLTIFRAINLDKIVEPSCHRSMCLRAAQFLVGSMKCTVGLYEVGSRYVLEKPDAIGFESDGTSILIECKTSRADFMVDKKKIHRSEGGMGSKRYFFTPEGLLSKDEIPKGWGLVEFRKTSIKKIKESSLFDADKECEQCLLISALALEQKILDKLVTEFMMKDKFVDLKKSKQVLFSMHDNEKITAQEFNAIRSIIEFYEAAQ